MSRILLTKTDNGWVTPGHTPFTINIEDDWYPIGTTIWVNPITKFIDTHPNGTEPSVIKPDGYKEWRVNGKLHRLDGMSASAALEWGNGTKVWCVNGQKHRLDGPAMEDRDGYKSWWENGKLHRIDGPAVEWADGYKAWWLNGQWHRIDGPAVEWADGTKKWYLNGKKHRIDGPAIEYSNGTKEWWVDGIQYTEEEYESDAVLDIRCKFADNMIKSAS